MSRGNIKNHTRPEVKISVSGGKIIEKSCPGDKRRKLSSIGGVQLYNGIAHSANSIMNVIKVIIIAVAYAIIELASQKVYIHISFL